MKKISTKQIKPILQFSKTKYKLIRVYDEYTNSPNISGIKSIFNKTIIAEDIINFLNFSFASAISNKLLGKNIEYFNNNSIKNKINRKFRLLIYSYLFFLPMKNFLYRKYNAYPNLKFRKLFNLTY